MSTRPHGDIVTLLDLTPRDMQDGELFPLGTRETWWLPDSERRLKPFTMNAQQFPFRGPAAFGQTFTFEIGNTFCGDLLLSAMLQIKLGHWLDPTTLLRLQAGTYTYEPGQDPFYYANALGSALLANASFELDDQVIEQVDGDFLNLSSLLFQDPNSQYGFGVDGLGRAPFADQLTTPSYRPFPTLDGNIFIPLPFFFLRTRLAEAFPLLACRKGTLRINITFRPFNECVRRLSGSRLDCAQTPLAQTFRFINTAGPVQTVEAVTTPVAPPSFQAIQLHVYTAHTDGIMRQRILRSPFELMHRVCKTFFFDEPLKYQTNKTSNDTIQVQLPLEVNHPIEEILWFVRRKDVANNNEWTNYSSVLAKDYNPVFNPRKPLLQYARLQFNGVDIISAEETWFRQAIAYKHKGGVAAFNSFVYGYSFANKPGEHQPSGSANASRLHNVRLTLDVQGGIALWEVKVFVIHLNWMRFQDGIANSMYQD